MEQRRAKKHVETMTGSEEEGGLVGVEDDRDFRQAISMAEQGFATLSGKGRSQGVKSRYSQQEAVASDHVEELPNDWDGMWDFLKEALKGRFRRFLADEPER